jgi:hypothetical protein
MSRSRNADVEELAAPEVDETELEVTNSPAEEGAEKEKVAKGPKRGTLPEGTVTPVGLAKILTAQGLHKNKEGVVIEVKPQMVYSYMKNSLKDDRLETHEVIDSNGTPRQVFVEADAVAWWIRKNERVAARKANVAEKAAKKAEKAAAQPEAEAEGVVDAAEAVEAE